MANDGKRWHGYTVPVCCSRLKCVSSNPDESLEMPVTMLGNYIAGLRHVAPTAAFVVAMVAGSAPARPGAASNHRLKDFQPSARGPAIERCLAMVSEPRAV